MECGWRHTFYICKCIIMLIMKSVLFYFSFIRFALLGYYLRPFFWHRVCVNSKKNLALLLYRPKISGIYEDNFHAPSSGTIRKDGSYTGFGCKKLKTQNHSCWFQMWAMEWKERWSFVKDYREARFRACKYQKIFSFRGTGLISIVELTYVSRVSHQYLIATIRQFTSRFKERLRTFEKIPL